MKFVRREELPNAQLARAISWVVWLAATAALIGFVRVTFPMGTPNQNVVALFAYLVAGMLPLLIPLVTREASRAQVLEIQPGRVGA